MKTNKEISIFQLITLCMLLIVVVHGLPQADIDKLVNKHNALRLGEQAADMKYMKWNTVLAEMAQKWAEACDYVHGQPTSVPSGTQVYSSPGQNLLFTTGTLDYTTSVQRWFDEKTDYTYAGPSCTSGKACGHYTQVVWASSYELGCGSHLCPTLIDSSTSNPQQSWANANHLVCNYGPAGNLGGARPYLKGTPCSKCASGNFWCQDNGLCRDCPGEGTTCPCKSQCLNCATSVASNCSCTCTDGWHGGDCSKACVDTDSKCGNTWPDTPQACANQMVRDGCPAQCKVCKAATSSTPTCASPGYTTANPGNEGASVRKGHKGMLTVICIVLLVCQLA